MKTYHIATFCNLPEDHPFTENVMEVVEMRFVFNSNVPPSSATVAGFLRIIAPGLEPLLSEVNEIDYVATLNKR